MVSTLFMPAVTLWRGASGNLFGGKGYCHVVGFGLYTLTTGSGQLFNLELLRVEAGILDDDHAHED